MRASESCRCVVVSLYPPAFSDTDPRSPIDRPSRHPFPLAAKEVTLTTVPFVPVTAIGDTVYHIYLAGESLAQIQTVATGTVTVGDSSQTGDILIEDCTIATTAGAATRIVQSTTGGGTILLSGSGINGNGGMVTLTSGTGGIEAGIWRGRVPLTTNGFDARGLPLTLQFYSAPTLGQQITLVNNTATPASSDPIIGTFTNLAPDKTLMVTYGRAVYAFQVDYAGGDGNDLVLTAVAKQNLNSMEDFDGNGLSDVLLQDQITGEVGAWLVQSGSAPTAGRAWVLPRLGHGKSLAWATSTAMASPTCCCRIKPRAKSARG